MIRKPRLDEADAIAALHVQAWRDGYAGVVPAAALAALSVEQRASMWRKQLSNDKSDTRVLVDVDVDVDGGDGGDVDGGGGGDVDGGGGGGINGFVSCGPARDADIAGDGEVYAIYVSSTRWRGGIGKRLIDAAEAAMKSHGFKRVHLWVLVDNPRARAFYEKHGWLLESPSQAPAAERVVTPPSAAAGLIEIRYVKTLAQA